MLFQVHFNGIITFSQELAKDCTQNLTRTIDAIIPYWCNYDSGFVYAFRKENIPEILADLQKKDATITDIDVIVITWLKMTTPTPNQASTELPVSYFDPFKKILKMYIQLL